MNYRALIRRKLLKQAFERMTDDDKRLYVQMTMRDQDHSEVMSALEELRHKADDNHHSFTSDLLANITGNAIFDGAIWLGSKLIKRL